MVAEQVDRHDAARCQTGAARAVELGRVEHRAARGGVVQIALQYVERFEVGRIVDEVERVHFQHAQARIVRRQLEHRFAHGDHGGIELDGGDGGVGEGAVAALRQRGTAQAQLSDRARRLDVQHPRHHLLRVFKFRPVRLADAHRALHPFRAEVQVAHAILFGQGDGGKFRLARGAAGGFDLFDGFSFDEHRAT